ncbi:MAG: hypothetical protein FJ255_03385 [Phycisphaerae bacterium]|nr:hypothetical protein [Phycisphaerae bacterium]
MRFAVAIALTTCLLIPAACEKAPPAAPADQRPQPKSTEVPSTAGHGGAVITLGSTAIGPFQASATRDQGSIVAGKDAPIDVTVTAPADSTAKVAAVRFWIGTQDARGSVKARAEVEDHAEPNRWHTHAEIPNPIPADARLWVEIEDTQGGVSVGSFDLKT